MAPVYLIEQLRVCVSADDGYIEQEEERKMYMLSVYTLRNAPNEMFERETQLPSFIKRVSLKYRPSITGA